MNGLPVAEFPPDKIELRCPECWASWELFIPRHLKFTSRFIECVVCNERFWDEQPVPSNHQTKGE